MPHENFEPPSPAGEEGSDCTITPPEDCNGHGTRDLDACDCNCDEGYKTDYKNLLDVQWCVKVEEEDDGRDKDLSGGEVVNGTTSSGGGTAGGVVFGTTPGIVIFVAVVVAIISLCVWWRWSKVRRKRGQSACCCSCWWLTCCLDCCGLICCTQRKRKEVDRRRKESRWARARHRSHAFLEEGQHRGWESSSKSSSTDDQHMLHKWATGHGGSHKGGAHSNKAKVKRHKGGANASHPTYATAAPFTPPLAMQHPWATALGTTSQAKGGAHEYASQPYGMGLAGLGIRSNIPPLMYPAPVLTSDPWAQAQVPVHHPYHPLRYSHSMCNAPRHPHHTQSTKPPPMHGPSYPRKEMQPFQHHLPYPERSFPHASTAQPLGPRGSYSRFSPPLSWHPPGAPHPGLPHWPSTFPFSSKQAGPLSINNPVFEMDPGNRDMQGSSRPYNRLQDGYVSVCMPSRKSKERLGEPGRRSPQAKPYQWIHAQQPGHGAQGSSRHNRRGSAYGRHRQEG